MITEEIQLPIPEKIIHDKMDLLSLPKNILE